MDPDRYTIIDGVELTEWLAQFCETTPDMDMITGRGEAHPAPHGAGSPVCRIHFR